MKAPIAASFVAAALWMVPVAPVVAQSTDSVPGHPVDLRPRLNLDASAWRDVVQDRVVATVYAEQESPEPAAGQAQVSRLLAPVLARLRDDAELEVQSAGYRTEPVWQKSRVVGWRTRGALQITGKPSEAFNALVGELATTLNLQSVTYLLSRETRLAVEQELITQAVKAFHEKADTAARALGFRGWEVRELSISGSGAGGPQPMPRTMAMSRAASADEAVPLPGAEGRTTVTTTVSGSVVLLP
ncbi:MAG: SIMPL domain-containing protein [Burkholderiaceae bacterium]|nr:SIMPL domain-containing protein [Burkholderiaceae bacterium]